MRGIAYGVGVGPGDPELMTVKAIRLIQENDVQEIVLGLPKNMNATEGIRAELSYEFKEKLERRTGLPVVMWDERLTTVAADKAMMEAGIRRENRKEYVDKIAAAFILQGYLDRRKNENEQIGEDHF